MNSRQTTQCEHIVEWLVLATKDLCESAKGRISAEIEAHYKEAVEAHLADGQSEIEARKIALRELGNPKEARRRLRKKHLTEWEQKVVQTHEEGWGKRPSLVPSLIFGLMAAGNIYFHHDRETLLRMGVLVVVFICVGWLPYLLIKFPPAKLPKAAAIFFSVFVQDIGMWAILLLLSPGGTYYIVPQLRWMPWTFLVIYCPVLLGRLYFWIRILQKLRNDFAFAVYSARS